MKTIPLTPTQQRRLARPIHGRGGFQGLLRRIQAGRRGNVADVSEADAERLTRYAGSYGRGGFQDRLKRRS